MKKSIACCLIILTAAMCQAADPAPSAGHLAKVNKYFEVCQMQKQYETGLISGFESASRNMGAGNAMSDEDKAKMDAGFKRVKELLVGEIGWAKVKDDMAKLYARHFTEEELDKIIKLLDNETGRMFVTKQIKILPESLNLAQGKVATLMPKVMEIMQEEMTKEIVGGIAAAFSGSWKAPWPVSKELRAGSGSAA